MKKNDSQNKVSDLRKRAEEKVLDSSKNLTSLSPDAAQQLLHELQVHQIELEMQNEELRRVQEELEASRTQYFDLYDLAPVGYFTISEKGLILRANLATTNMLGVERRTLLKQPLTRFITKEDQDIYYMHRRQLPDTQEPQLCELRMVRKDGTLFWVQINATLAQDSESGATVCLAVLSDITERKQVEAAIRLAEENFHNSIDESPLGVRVVTEQGKTVYANKAILDIYGFASIDELNSTPRIKYYTQESYAEHQVRKEKRKRGEHVPPEYEISIMKKTGELRHLQVLRREVQWNGAKQFQVLYQDITDSKRLEEEQQRVAKLESIGILAGGIAHDFNNILTAILGNISLAKIKTDPGSELYDSLGKAEKASFRAKDLTQQLITFSKGGAPVKKLASISELLKETTNFALRGSNVNCQFYIANDLWHSEIDEGQISQVINNLVINARQAMPSGGTIKLSAENMILTEEQSLGKRLPLQKGKYIRIAVSDHGTGIQEKHLDKIFDPFFTTKQTGSGLGLASSFSIVRNHGGYISVESKLGSGSTFYIYLPASTKTATTRKVEDKKTTLMTTIRILVMDDEEMVREVAGNMLKQMGCKEIQFAADGNEAIKLYKEAMKTGKPFDAVILDITIPGGMGGIETIKKLCEIDPKVKAIVSSGYSSESSISEYKECGFSGVVTKPYTIDQLRQVLQELIG